MHGQVNTEITRPRQHCALCRDTPSSPSRLHARLSGTLRSRNARARRHLRLVRGRRVSSTHSPSSPPPWAPRPTSASPTTARSGPFCLLFSSKIDHIRPSSGLAPSPGGVGVPPKKVEIMSKEMPKHPERARVGGAEVGRGVRGDDDGGGCTTAANEAQMSTRARVSRSRRFAATPQTHGV